jgi:uncharacterized tellurite resistance protein B-like protein
MDDLGTSLTALDSALKKFDTSKKAWRDLVEAGLVAPARQRITGTKQYGLTARQLDRLAFIATAKQRLKQRFTLSALGYQMAADGIQEPAVKVLAHKETRKRAKGLLGAIRRSGQRTLGLRSAKQRMSDSTIYAAAQKVLKKLNRNSKRQFSVSDAPYLIAIMLLRVIYGDGNVQTHVRGLKELLLATLSINHPVLGRLGLSISQAQDYANQITAMLSSVGQFLTVDKKRNPLLSKNSSVSDSTFWLAFNIGRDVTQILWLAYDEISKEFSVPHYDATMRQVVEGTSIAMLLAMQKDPRKTEDFKILMTGDISGVERAADSVVKMVRILKQFMSLKAKVRISYER